MPQIDISADGKQAFDELTKFESALDATADRFKNLNSIVVKFNKDGEEIGAVVKSQTGAFERLTQVLDKNGIAVQSFYSKNEEGARRAAEQSIKQAAADEQRAAAATRRYDRETQARNNAIDKEIAARDRAKNKAEKDAKDEADRIAKQGTLLENVVSRVGRTVINTAISKSFSAITTAIEGSVKAAKDFQVQTSLIRTISQGKDQQSFGATSRDIRSVSDSTGFDIKDVGKAFYDATSNQITKGAATKEFVKTAAEFARVTGSELPDSVNLLSTAINSYGLSAADAEKISAIFFKTIDEGRVVASEMANTLGRLYPLASQVGVSMTEVNAAFAITTQKGVKTNDAITLLSNLLIKLEKPTEQTAEFFKSLGVNSGEAAVQLYGFTGLIQKMVDAVNSGQVPVSAFFDEIRGRKQFAVFQQSIGAIDEFNKKLQDTKTVTAEYNAAKVIRGESPGDQLAKEANKLSNVFKVELGQAILENLNIVNKWVGGVDGIRESVGGFKNVLVAGTIAVVGYNVVTNLAAVSNFKFAISFAAVKAGALSGITSVRAFAATTAGLATAFGAVAGASYLLASNTIFSADRKFNFNIDPAVVDQATSAIERFQRVAAGVKEVANPFESLDKQKASVEETFKSIGQLNANATVENNKALEDAKDKAKNIAETVKLAFAGFTDATKKGISDIKKGISDANAEIQRSKKSLESFGDKGQEALFNFRSKYANDDFGQQKILLTQQKISDTQKRADAEYAKGTEESIAEARKLYDIVLSEEVKLEELKVENRKKAFEADLQQHPERHNFPGGNIFSVDDAAITTRIAQLTAQQAANEERVVKLKQEAVRVGKQQETSEEGRLKALEAALKKYEAIDIFNKAGDLKSEYKTQGRFDPNKFNKALDEAEGDIRKSAGGDVNTRFQLEVELSKFRVAKTREAVAQERAENLKGNEARFAAEKDGYVANLEAIKDARQKNQAKEKDQLGGLLGGQQILAAFNTQIREGGRNFNQDPRRFEELDKGLTKYQAVLVKLQASRRVENGVEFFDPEILKEATKVFDETVDKYIEVKNYFGNRAGNLDAKGISAAGAKANIKQTATEAIETAGGLVQGAQEEAVDKSRFDKNVAGPVTELKNQLPQLATQGAKSLGDLDNSFKSLNNGGVEQLKQKLLEIQKLIPKGGLPEPAGEGKGGFKTSSLDSGEVYAATGGIVGQFPGQPKGVDRYPIWAAKGEYIINAETSAMYAPMLNAIMQRRAPRYMAEGGVVGGGTTNIGDINVTVNGATTNTETARVIGNRLERQLRQNNIRLDRRS